MLEFSSILCSDIQQNAGKYRKYTKFMTQVGDFNPRGYETWRGLHSVAKYLDFLTVCNNNHKKIEIFFY